MPRLGQTHTPEVQARLDELCVELSAMRPTLDLVKTFAKKWKVTEKTVYAYIARIQNDGAIERKKVPRESRIEFRLHQAELILQACISTGKMAAAVQIFDRICKIEGLYQAEQVAHNIVHQIEGLTVQEKTEQVNELLQRRQEYIKQQNKLRAVA